MMKFNFFQKTGLAKQILLPAGVIFIALIVFVWLTQSKAEKVTGKRHEKSWLVSAVSVNIQDLSPEITIYGRVETPQRAILKSALVADVTEVNVLEGEKVKRGQVLVRLDDTDMLLLLRQRQASVAEIDALIASELLRHQRDKSLLQYENELLKLADKAVQRANELEQTQLLSQANLDEQMASKQRQILTVKRLQHDINDHPVRLANLKAKRLNYQALAEQAKVNLKRTVIYAPFAGRIATLDVAVGDRVSAGTDLLSLYDLASLEVRAQLPNRYVTSIRASLNDDEEGLQAMTSDVDGQTLGFLLTRLAGEIRPDSGGIDGLFSLASGNTSLVLGTFVKLSLKLMPEKSVIPIPFNALYGLDRVYLIEDGYLRSVKVTRVGEYQPPTGKKMLLIRSADLKQGDNIVSTQLPNVTTGLKVKVIN